MIEWLDSSISSSVHVPLLARECKNERVTIRSARPTPRRQKSATSSRNVADRVPDKRRRVTTPRFRPKVSQAKKECMKARRRKLPDLSARLRPHIRKRAANRTLRQLKKSKCKSQS